MKRLIQFVALILCITSKTSAENINSMTLWMESGKQLVYLLDDEPVVKFTGDDVVVTTTFEEIMLPAKDVLRYTLGYTDLAGVVNPVNMQVKFNIDGNKLYFYGMERDDLVEVYSIAGILIAKSNANQAGEAVVILPDDSDNIFVVKTSTANFKLRKP